MTTVDDILLDRFLAKELSTTEVVMLEGRLSRDNSLRRRLALRRELYEDRSEEASLRKVLKIVDRKYHTRLGWRRRWWVLLLSALIGGLVYWFSSDGAARPEATPAQPVMSSPEVVLPDSADLSAPTVPPVPQSNQPAVEEAPKRQPVRKKPEATPAKSTPAPPPTQVKPVDTTFTEVYAALDPALFTPNDMLESIVEAQFRSAHDTTILSVPKEDTLSRKHLLPVWVSTTVPPPYELVFYDNQPASFLETRPLEQVKLPALNTRGNRYTTTAKLPAPRKAGRHYVLLLDDEGEVLACRVVLFR